MAQRDPRTLEFFLFDEGHVRGVLEPAAEKVPSASRISAIRNTAYSGCPTQSSIGRDRQELCHLFNRRTSSPGHLSQTRLGVAEQASRQKFAILTLKLEKLTYNKVQARGDPHRPPRAAQ